MYKAPLMCSGCSCPVGLFSTAYPIQKPMDMHHKAGRSLPCLLVRMSSFWDQIPAFSEPENPNQGCLSLNPWVCTKVGQPCAPLLAEICSSIPTAPFHHWSWGMLPRRFLRGQPFLRNFVESLHPCLQSDLHEILFARFWSTPSCTDALTVFPARLFVLIPTFHALYLCFTKRSPDVVLRQTNF